MPFLNLWLDIFRALHTWPGTGGDLESWEPAFAEAELQPFRTFRIGLTLSDAPLGC